MNTKAEIANSFKVGPVGNFCPIIKNPCVINCLCLSEPRIEHEMDGTGVMTSYISVPKCTHPDMIYAMRKFPSKFYISK